MNRLSIRAQSLLLFIVIHTEPGIGLSFTCKTLTAAPPPPFLGGEGVGGCALIACYWLLEENNNNNKKELKI